MARMVSVDASADAPCIGRSVEMVSVLALPPPPPAVVLPVVPPPLLLFELLQAVTALSVTACKSSKSSSGGGTTGSTTAGGGGGSAKTLTISTDLPMQGASADASTDTIRAIQLYLDQINHKAGPYTIQLKTYDDSTAAAGKWDEATCANNAQAH